MATLAQQLWNQLGAPLDIVEKGKYAPDKQLAWKFKILPKNFASSNDQSFWQKTVKKDLVEFFSQGLQCDHECQPDDNFRCKFCGKILKWIVYGPNKIMKPYHIYYYDFNYIIMEKKENDDIVTFNFTEINTIQAQREFALYIICRQPGMGFADYLAIRSMQVPKTIADYKFTGDKFHKKFEFYGDFESANLKTMFIDQQAQKCKILLKSDSNSFGFAQWFYFGVKFWGSEPHKVTFSIANQKKTHSQFSKGMKFYVGYLDPEKGLTWQQYSQDIIYTQSEFRRKKKEDEPFEGPLSLFFNKLEFDFTFQTSGERVLFSYYKPYTFTDLIEFIEKTEQSLKEKENVVEDFSAKSRTTFITTENTYYKKEIIGGSRLGLSLFMIEITCPKKFKPSIPYDKRKVVLILGRQHPFETPSSLVCQGFINFLISDNPVASQLKSMFIFKICPMVNPDGVVIGNSRTNLSGADLNRSWENPTQNAHPEVYFLKQYISKMRDKKKDIFMFIDLHATATKANSFLVGCEQAHGLSSNYNWISNRLITKLMQETMCHFREKNCKFNLKQKNQCTARVILWKEFKAKYSFNLEFSMNGYRLNEFFMSQQFRKEERDRLKVLLENGKIDYDEYAELVDQIKPPSQVSVSEPNTSRSHQSQINEEQIQKNSQTSRSLIRQISQGQINNATSPSLQNRNLNNYNNPNNPVLKKVPITKFQIEDYEQIAVDFCHNLLKFTLMTSMMQVEIEQSGQKDLDISKVKKENEIKDQISQGGSQEQIRQAEGTNSFSQKVGEIYQNSPKSRKSFTKKNEGKSPTTNKQSPLKRLNSIGPNKLQKQNSITVKENELPQNDLDQNNNEIKKTPKKKFGGKSNFFKKIQKKILLANSNQDESEEGDSINSSSQMNLDNSGTQEQSKYGFKLNLEEIQNKKSFENSFEEDKLFVNSPIQKSSGATKLQKQSSFAIQTQDSKMNTTNQNVKVENKKSGSIFMEKEIIGSKQKQFSAKLQNLTNPPPLNLQAFEIQSPLSNQSSINYKSNSMSPGSGSPQNGYLQKISNIGNAKLSLSNSGQSFKQSKNYKFKSKSKLTYFVKFIIGQSLNIKNLFPDMRSYDWEDYFSFQEIESQLGEKGVEFKLIQMMNQNMEPILEYDTDSNPEDDLIDSFQHLDYLNDKDDEDTERQNIIKDINSKFGEKFKGKLKGQKIDDLQGILDGSHEVDENGKLKKKEIKQQKINELNGENSNIWLSNLKKNRSRQDSNSSRGSSKNNANQDYEDSPNRSNSNWAKKSDYSLKRQSPKHSNDIQNQQNGKTQSYNSRLLLPKVELLKLKNPFLPSSHQVNQFYNSKNITKVLQEERDQLQTLKKIKKKKTDLMMLTTYSSQGYQKDKKIQIDPSLCMAGATFFCPSKTIQQKQEIEQNNSRSQTLIQSSHKFLRSQQNSFKDSANSTAYNAHSKSSSIIQYSKNNPLNRKESDLLYSSDYLLENTQIYRDNSHYNNDFVKEESKVSFKIKNSQFGSLILPVDNYKIPQIKEQKQTKTLVVYQSRLNKDPYQISSVCRNASLQKLNANLQYQSNSIIKDESKKTVVSFYRKANKES
ncbi:zinc carboxypeptidase family protein (macronuclear) [Tetrahymena thermophila SB210]|uniref:Zinc carboxypeptidase family protein n=1 Tax=Tetrahymena thermophila (strain SB210) TaxID=312017 RepID=I7M9I8_TETTS|nr:zinc carboxypeptidase family protein [Tetrahymena thermophila SB210]EAS01836.2 zinc carboxypeptidase family protein [Tetrahymena thermophila SB210]|eukprot:XP_001022081.2 zinc carboxypeptidase family protein [Tetrahymena thermophila SB210]